MDHTANLAQHLKSLDLPADAQEWLMDVWGVCQLIDDAADGDEIGPARAYEAAWSVFVRLHTNTFWDRAKAVLLPVLALQVLKWRASDEAERDGAADERSFVWRAGFYDLVLSVCQLCGIPNAGRAVLAMYGETFEDYRGEFPCPTP